MSCFDAISVAGELEPLYLILWHHLEQGINQRVREKNRGQWCFYLHASVVGYGQQLHTVPADSELGLDYN